MTYVLDEGLSQEAKNMITKLNNQEKNINYKKLNFRRDKYLGFHFSDYKSLKELLKETYYRKISKDRAEDIQKEYSNLLDVLEKYRPRNPDYIEKRKKSVWRMQEIFIMVVR